VGFTGGVRSALGHGKEAAGDFGAQVRELLGFFTGEHGYPGVRAYPAEGLRVPPFLLATGSGADLAAELGLPLVIAPVRGERALAEAVTRYRDGFRPSAWAREPYVVVSTAIAVADSAAQARRLLVSEAWATVYSRSHGVFPPLEPPAEILAAPMTDPSVAGSRRLWTVRSPGHRPKSRTGWADWPHSRAPTKSSRQPPPTTRRRGSIPSRHWPDWPNCVRLFPESRTPGQGISVPYSGGTISG